MLSPVTPSTNSSFILLVAAARVMASRRSVRYGRFRTRIFSNFSNVRLDISGIDGAKRGETESTLDRLSM